MTLIDDWHGHLLADTWRERPTLSGVRRLLTHVFDAKAGLDQARRSGFNSAAATPLEPLGLVIEDGQSGQRPNNLDEWIARHLVNRGEALLVPKERRRGQLARMRDMARRSRRLDQQYHGARVELPVEACDKVRAIRSQMRAPSKEKLLLGDVLERVIEAQFDVMVLGKRRNRKQHNTPDDFALT